MSTIFSKSKLLPVNETGRGLNKASIMEIIDKNCSIVKKMILDLQQNKGDAQAELSNLLHQIWPKSFSELSTTSEVAIFKKLIVASSIISILPKVEVDEESQVFSAVYGVTPLRFSEDLEDNARVALELIKLVDSIKLLVQKRGRGRGATCDVKYGANVVSVLNTSKCNGTLIEAANFDQIEQLISMIEQFAEIRLEAINLAQMKIEHQMPFVLGGGEGSGVADEDDRTNNASHGGEADEETKETNDVSDNNVNGGTDNSRRINWDDVIIYITGTIDNDITTEMITTMRSNSNDHVIVVDDTYLYLKIIRVNEQWNNFQQSYYGPGGSVVGFKSLINNIGKLDTTAALNKTRALQVFRSISNKYMSDTLISDVNDHIAMLKERDRHTFVETPAVIWKIVQELSLKGILEFPEATIKSQIDDILGNGTIGMKERVEVFRVDPLENLLALDEMLTKVENMREDWLKLCTTEYTLPSGLKWQALIEILRSWTVFVMKESHQDTLQKIVDECVPLSTSEVDCESLWGRYHDQVHEFINKLTTYKELSRVRDPNEVSRAFWSSSTITSTGNSSNTSNKSKAKSSSSTSDSGGGAGNQVKNNQKWRSDSTVLTLAQTRKAVEAGKEAANVTRTNSNNFHSVMVKVQQYVDRVYPGKKLPPEFAFCNNCGDFGSIRTKCTNCNPSTTKVHMTKLSNTHSMIKVGDRMIPINKVVFLDTCCEAFFVTNDQTGVTNVRATNISLETVSGIHIIRKMGEIMGQKVLIDSDFKHSLLGLGALCDVLGEERFKYEGTKSGINLIFDGEVILTGHRTTTSKLPVCSKSDLLEALARISNIIDDERSNVLKVMIARTRGSTYDSDEVVGAGGVTVPVTSDGHASKTATHAKGKKKDGGGKPKSSSTNQKQVPKLKRVRSQKPKQLLTQGKQKQEPQSDSVPDPVGDRLGGSDKVSGGNPDGMMPTDNGITTSPLDRPLVDENQSSSLFPDLRDNGTPAPLDHSLNTSSTSDSSMYERLKMGPITSVDGIKMWLDESSDNGELEINMERIPYGDANPIDDTVSMRVKYAYTFSRMLGKTSERSIRLLLAKQPELLEHFDLDDWKIAHKSFLQPSLLIATQRKKFQRGGSLHTNVPGEILHMDMLQLGGATKSHEVGKIQLALLVIDHYSRFEVVIPFDSKSSDAVTGAIDKAILLMKQYCARNKIAGAGIVREIRTDADPLFKRHTDYYRKKGIWLKLGGTNYHEKISEANIQHTKDLVSMTCEQLPIEPPCWLVVLFLIGVVGWKNLIPKGTDKLSPYEKLTGLPVRYDRLVTAGTGQLGVTRRSSAEMKKRPTVQRGEQRVDSMVSKVRGVLAIAICPDYNNMNAILVLLIKSDSMDATCVDKLISSPDFRSIPATAELFPTCFPRKALGALGRFCAANHWMTWEVQHMMANLRNSSVHNGVNDTEEEEVRVNEVDTGSSKTVLPQSSLDRSSEQRHQIDNPDHELLNDNHDEITRVLLTMKGNNNEPCIVSDVEHMVGSTEQIHASELLSYSNTAAVRDNKNEEEEARDDCMISEIASEEVYKAFMTRGFTREAMKDRKVNLGLDLFLNLKGSHYWSTPEETRVAEEYAAEIVDEVIRDSTAPSQLLLKPLWRNDDHGDGKSL